VIYLTHHAHLCDLARNAAGDAVTLHKLGAPGAAAQAVTTEPAG